MITVTLTAHYATIGSQLRPREIAGVHRPFGVIGAVITGMTIKIYRARTLDV
jgi:hypothetical protein